MATQVVNPSNAPPVKNQALPFIRREGTNTVKANVIPYNARESKPFRENKKKDSFNSGKDYQDEGAPLLTSEVDDEGRRLAPKPYAVVTNPLVIPPTKEEMEALSHPDESSQTQIKYLREAVVMDVDAKLIVSTVAQMKNGMFREAHYPTLIDYVKSPHYRQLREARIVSEQLAGLARKTKLLESDRTTIAGIRLNPRLVSVFKAADARVYKRLKESGFPREIKKLREAQGLLKPRKLREDAFTQDDISGTSGLFGQFGPNWDGGQSFGLAGREPDFIPLMAGPFNKQLYWFDYLDMHSKCFEAWNHNPIAKRIVKVITQFVLGKGVKLTVMRAVQRSQEQQYKSQPQSGNLIALAKQVAQGQGQQPDDWKPRCQGILDRHWKMNKLHITVKKIFRSLLIFGEQFIRYFDAPWGLRIRQIDPSVVWEIVTDPDDPEHEFYLHCQYPTQYQWYVDLPVPTIKFIIRQVPSALYYHMKINTVEGEKRGRSELFVILGWLKRLKEYATDRVIRNKMANLFVLDVAVEGDASAVQAIQAQFQTPPTPGSFFIHNKAAELNGVKAEVGASETQGDWEMLLTIIAMGAGISKMYLGMGETAGGGKAGAMIGTEPDIKTFEDHQELMEDFLLEDSSRVFERAKEKGEIPKDLSVTVEVTFPALAEENRSEKLKDLAFMESMSWVSHRRVASAAAKEMQMTSYDYDQEQEQIAQEDAMKEFLINTAYQQVTKGVDSAQQAAAGKAGGGTSSGSSGKGASGMGMGKALPTSSKASVGESDRMYLAESDEDDEMVLPATAPGSSTASGMADKGTAVTHNASRGKKELPWRGSSTDESTGKRSRYRGDPRDTVTAIRREAENLRYQRRGVGRRQDRVQTPDKVRDQKSRDRGEVLSDARQAIKSGNLNKETDGIRRFPRLKDNREGMEPFKKTDGDKLQRPRVETVPEHNAHPRGSGKKLSPSGYANNKR